MAIETPIVDKHARRISCMPHDAKLRAKISVGVKDDSGWVQGYAAAFDNVDRQNEIIRKGAFMKSIQERVPAGKVKLMAKHWAHGGDSHDVIGTITQMKEDEYGLWYEAVFSGVQLAQDMRQKVVEGHIGHNSVGYGPVKWNFIEEDGKDVIIEHVEAKIYEVTLTVRPANELAGIVAAKSLDGLSKQLEEKITELTDGKDVDALSSDERSRIIQAVGSTDALSQLSKSIVDLQGRLAQLLAEPPQNTKAAKVDVDLHDIGMEIERYRLAMNKLSI